MPARQRGYPRFSEAAGLFAQVVDTRENAGMTVEFETDLKRFNS
jgi:hypothetical protein